MLKTSWGRWCIQVPVGSSDFLYFTPGCQDALPYQTVLLKQKVMKLYDSTSCFSSYNKQKTAYIKCCTSPESNEMRLDLFITRWFLRWRSLCPGSCIRTGWDPRTHPSPCCLRRPCRSEISRPGLPPSPPAVQSTFPPDRIRRREMQQCFCSFHKSHSFLAPNVDIVGEIRLHMYPSGWDRQSKDDWFQQFHRGRTQRTPDPVT